MYIYICVCVRAYIYIYMYIWIMSVSMYVCICTYIYMCHCKQNRTQSFCPSQWISKQLHVLPPLSTTWVTAFKCGLFWHYQNSRYLLSSLPFMFSLLFLLLSWKHFFFFLTFLLVCHFSFHPFFLHIFLSFFIPSQWTFRFYCQHSSIHYFFLFPFFYVSSSCTHTHTYVHMYITHSYIDLTPLLHNNAPLYPLRNTAYLGGRKYQTSPSGEIT